MDRIQHAELIHPGDIVTVPPSDSRWRVAALVSNLPGGPHLDLLRDGRSVRSLDEPVRVVEQEAIVVRCVRGSKIMTNAKTAAQESTAGATGAER